MGKQAGNANTGASAVSGKNVNTKTDGQNKTPNTISADDIIDDASGGLARYILVNGLENEIAAIVYPDSRGDGYGIARFQDHPQLDFTRVQDETDVHFAHNSGFLCKTSAAEKIRLNELLAGAWH